MTLPFTAYAVAIAVGMNSIELCVTDVSYAKVHGVDVQTIEDKRHITAAVDATNTRKMEQIFGGSVSDGSIMIYITDQDVELYFVDTQAVNSSRHQSFIYYGMYQYRVQSVADWTLQAGCRVYLADRHITQDLV